jgi:hypothetical protein
VNSNGGGWSSRFSEFPGSPESLKRSTRRDKSSSASLARTKSCTNQLLPQVSAKPIITAETARTALTMAADFPAKYPPRQVANKDYGEGGQRADVR